MVAGWQDASNGVRQGAIWKNGVQQILTDNDGNILGAVAALSADGKTAVGINNMTGAGYIWNETEGTTYVTSDRQEFRPTVNMSAELVPISWKAMPKVS